MSRVWAKLVASVSLAAYVLLNTHFSLALALCLPSSAEAPRQCGQDSTAAPKSCCSRCAKPTATTEPAPSEYHDSPSTPGDKNAAPSDAIVLFDGKSFDAWKGGDKHAVDADGGFTSKGGLQTKQGFGDCQLHLEFASPNPAKGNDQGRGNNGIGLMNGRYEIQVLDSYQNKTYPEGFAGSVYNQRPPMVNASRKPGEWQTYDIIFTAPRRDADGKVTTPAYATVLHNGVLVQNHTEVKGSTFFDRKPIYEKHADKEPLVLMYHGDPVRFRNIWIREFKELEAKEKAPAK